MMARTLCALLATMCMLSAPESARVPVTIHVTVTDSGGLPITDLEPGEFEVFTGGAAVRASVSSAAGSPVTFVLLVDATASLAPIQNDLKVATTALLAQLKTGDRLLVHGVLGPFATAPLTRDARPAALEDLLGRVFSTPQEPSPLWDALVKSIDAAETDERSLAALLVTDGRATANRCSVNDAADRAVRAGVHVSALVLRGGTIIRRDGDLAVMVDPGRIVRQLTTAVGGRYIDFHAQVPAPGSARPGFNTPAQRLTRAFSTWVEQTRNRYALQLDLPVTVAVQPISVQVKRRGAIVIAPRAYGTPDGLPSCASGSPS